MNCTVEECFIFQSFCQTWPSVCGNHVLVSCRELVHVHKVLKVEI
jgi:hypothetical protein